MKDFEDQLLNQLQALGETAPELPEEASQRWKKAVHEMSQMEEPRFPVRKKRIWPRVLAGAAAAVFLLTGTLLAGEYMPRKLSDISSVSSTASRQAYTSDSYDFNDFGAFTGGMTSSTSMNSVPMAAMEMAQDYDAYPSADTAASTAAVVTDTRKLVRTVSLSITTSDFDGSYDAITGACTLVGGYISNSSVSSRSSRSASITLRIPADRLDDFLVSAGTSGRITSRSEKVEDITDNYFDLQSRLDSQKALLSRMRELAAQATDMEDLLTIEASMADTQSIIDSYTGTLRRMDNRVAYATVDISLNESIPRTTIEDRTLTFEERVTSALQSGWETFAEFCTDMVIFIVGMLPFLALLSLLIGTIVFIVRRRR